MGQLIGFDSMNNDSLRWMNKTNNLRETDSYKNAIEVLRKYNFQTWASFILGNDYDTEDAIKKTVEFAIRSKFTLAYFHMLAPYPNTEIFDQFREEGRLLYDGKWWLHPDYRYNSSPFIPKHMPPVRLSELVVWANKYFYALNSIAKRFIDMKTNFHSLFNALFFLKFNFLMRNTSIRSDDKV